VQSLDGSRKIHKGKGNVYFREMGDRVNSKLRGNYEEDYIFVKLMER
jgi:hypothetical protein